jgi:hypothetical protein
MKIGMLFTFIVLCIFGLRANAAEYGFTNGMRAVYQIKTGDIGESCASCHVVLECVAQSADGKFDLTLRFDNFGYAFTNQTDLAIEYSNVCAQIKEFTTKTTVNATGGILASDLARVLEGVKLSDSRTERLLKNNVLLRHWSLFFEYVIPEIGSIDLEKDNKVFLPQRKWGFIGNKELKIHDVSGMISGWMNITKIARIPGVENNSFAGSGRNNLLLWRDIIEKEGSPEYSSSIKPKDSFGWENIITTKTRMYFAKDVELFSKVEIQRSEDIKLPKGAHHVAVFFEAKLVECKGQRKVNKVPMEFIKENPDFYDKFSRELENNPEVIKQYYERRNKEKESKE